MAAVYKRSWKAGSGEIRTGWVCTYIDREGVQRRKQFRLKRDADDERIRIEGELAAGVHVADKKSITVLGAAKAFLADFEGLVDAGKRDRETFRMYRQFVDHHIAPFEIAQETLSRLTGPVCKQFAKELEKGRSEALAVRVFRAFRMILAFAVSEGWMGSNPARSIKMRTGPDGEVQKPKLEFPTKAQLRALVETAQDYDDTGKMAALISLLLFGGLRISEVRAVRVTDVKLTSESVQVCQSADRWQGLGPLKSANARRTVPLPRHTLDALRRWMKSVPLSKDGLLFPNGVGNVESYANLYHRAWLPLLRKAKLVDDKNAPLLGIHALRHAAISLWIESGASPKKVMTWSGHHSIQFTMDTYGHLWEDAAGDAAIAASAAERLFRR